MRDYLNILKSFENLRDVPEAELNWLLAHGEIRRFSEGEYLFHTGDPIENLCLILEGHLSLRLEQMGQFKELTAIEAPGMVGLLPYSRAGKAQSAGIFSEEAIVLIVPGKHFGEMISHQHKLVAGLVHQMLDRVRQFTEQTHQFEKLLAMGKLAAGLAHELNNPLTGISLTLQNLMKNIKVYNNEQLQERLSLIQNDLHRASNIVSDIISFAKPEKIKLTYSDIMETISKARETVQRLYPTLSESVVWDLTHENDNFFYSFEGNNAF